MGLSILICLVREKNLTCYSSKITKISFRASSERDTCFRRTYASADHKQSDVGGDRRSTAFQARFPFLRIDSLAQKLAEKPAAMPGRFLMFPHPKISL
jgi:hypothetical protein